MPNDISYLFNTSLIYEKLNQPRRAEATVDQYMSLGESDVDSDHLSHAVQAYTAIGHIKDAQNAFRRLVSKDPAKARMLTLDDEIRKVIGVSGA